MRRNNIPFRRDHIGMPDRHAEKFAEIARAEGVIIISRAVGPTCLQLLEQGYDTKGFRIHGKSCNWGPMAGFVMRDPRLNKSKLAKEAYNRHEHRTALRDTGRSGWRASTTPLKITEARLRWLQEKSQVTISGSDGGGTLWGRVIGDVAFVYQLRWDATEQLWGVYIDNSRSTFRQEKGSGYFSTRFGWIGRSGLRPKFEPLMAMTNPPEHRAYPEGHYLNAITGDYDLFAVWPRADSYDPKGQDRRVLGTARVLTHQREIDRMEQDFVQRRWWNRSQGTKLGNMTDRIYQISQLLNSAIATARTSSGRGGSRKYDRRQVCWHSTESARPYVNDVDLPIIAFIPHPEQGVIELGVETIQDFRNLIAGAEHLGYRPLLAEGWTLEPDEAKPNRLGAAFADRVPADSRGGQQKVPRWYNA